jgi:hypothetical protein
MERKNIEKGFAGHCIRILVRMMSVPALVPKIKAEMNKEVY